MHIIVLAGLALCRRRPLSSSVRPLKLMNRRMRLRRTGILCLHVLRNLAFLRAMSETRQTSKSGQFWITAHNNFLDIAILEWCKLFTDKSGKHNWRKCITDQEGFFAGMLAHLNAEESGFGQYEKSLKFYRDKFVAHLDEQNDIIIQNLTIARLSTQFFYGWLRHKEDDCNAYHDSPLRSEDFYAVNHAHARKVLREEA